MRIECTAPGLERNWVDVADLWTRRDTTEMYAAQGEAFYELLRRRLVACHVELTTGQAIDTPAGITTDAIQDADEAVLGWLGVVLPIALAKRRALGEASARVSSAGNAPS